MSVQVETLHVPILERIVAENERISVSFFLADFGYIGDRCESVSGYVGVVVSAHEVNSLAVDTRTIVPHLFFSGKGEVAEYPEVVCWFDCLVDCVDDFFICGLSFF